MTMVEVVFRKAPKIRAKSRQQPCFLSIIERGWKKTLLTALPPPNVMNNV
jgi:hypothetical protein